MNDGLGVLGARVIVGAQSLAELRSGAGTRAIGKVLAWAAGGTDTDRDPGSDRRVVKRVRALHHSIALGRITQTECRGRARHLEYIIKGRHIWSRNLHIMKENKMRQQENRLTETKYKERGW